MKLRAGEWVVVAGSGVLLVFAVVVGVLIYIKPPPVEFVYLESAVTVAGEDVYRMEGCGACHEIFGNGAAYGPRLDGIGSKRKAAWLHAYLRAPWQGVSEKPYRLKMPGYEKLGALKLDALVVYLQALRRVDASGQLVQPPPTERAAIGQ